MSPKLLYFSNANKPEQPAWTRTTLSLPDNRYCKWARISGDERRGAWFNLQTQTIGCISYLYFEKQLSVPKVLLFYPHSHPLCCVVKCIQPEITLPLAYLCTCPSLSEQWWGIPELGIYQQHPWSFPKPSARLAGPFLSGWTGTVGVLSLSVALSGPDPSLLWSRASYTNLPGQQTRVCPSKTRTIKSALKQENGSHG